MKTCKRLAIALLACAALLIAAYLLRAPLLRSAAAAWIVNDPTTNADAIVVLGGGLDDRPFAAARLYTNGIAKTILLAQSELSPAEELGLRPPDFVTAREILLKSGVPSEAIQPLGTNVTSTRDEANALAAWAVQHQARNIVIPTEIFHTRRARWICRKALAQAERSSASSSPSTSPPNPAKAEDPASSSAPPAPGSFACSIHLVALDPPRYTRTNWWRVEQGLIDFQNEIVKSVYYHLKY